MLKPKTVFFDRKTLFIADKQCFSIYYTSGLPYPLRVKKLDNYKESQNVCKHENVTCLSV